MGLPAVFGSNPESAATVRGKLDRLHTTEAVRKEFIASDEYMKSGGIFNISGVIGREPPMVIEEELSAPDLERLYNHIQRVWEHLGDTEPHWSVLSSETVRSNNISKDSEITFFETGRESAEILFGTLTRNGIDPNSYTTCLEYGCGLGRVTHALATRFHKVFGYDISRSHLRCARKYLDKSNISNVTLQHVLGVRDIQDLPKVDLVYSVIVLQHNPPPIINLIVRELIKCLSPGGVAFFQIPTYIQGYCFDLKHYLDNQGEKSEIEMHVLPQSKVLDIVYSEGGRVVEILEDGWAGRGKGLRSNTFVVKKT